MERNVIEQFVSIKVIEYRYHSCPDFNTSLNSSHSQYEKRKEEIEKAYIEWYDDILFYNERIPNDAEFLNEINSIKEILRFIDSNMDPDRFYKNGPDDTALCKIYLKRMKDKLWDEDIEDIKCLFFALQWLLRKQSEEYPISLTDEIAATERVAVEEDEETAMLRKFLEKLKPHFKRGVTYRLLFIAKDICHSELIKPYAITIQKFSEKIAPMLDKKPKSLNTQICKAGELLKIEGTCNYRRIATLTKEQINMPSGTQQSDEYELWKKQYELVKSLMPSEILS